MRTFLWKLFPPYEVAATKKALSEFLDAHDGLARSCIEKITFQFLKRDPKTVVDAIRLDHKTPIHVALSIIVALLRIQLRSGNYHTYRGTLSMIGENMRSVWGAALKESVALGLVTPESAEEIRVELADEVRCAG